MRVGLDRVCATRVEEKTAAMRIAVDITREVMAKTLGVTPLKAGRSDKYYLGRRPNDKLDSSARRTAGDR